VLLSIICIFSINNRHHLHTCYIIVRGPFCWKCIRVKSYTNTCTVRLLECRYKWPALHIMSIDWLIFDCDGREKESKEISYSNACSLFTFFGGFILWQHRSCFCAWLCYKRERKSKHSATWLILGDYAPVYYASSYKSDSLVFRWSFYYFKSDYAFIVCEYFIFKKQSEALWFVSTYYLQHEVKYMWCFT
jgi:hypothetical protein